MKSIVWLLIGFALIFSISACAPSMEQAENTEVEITLSPTSTPRASATLDPSPTITLISSPTSTPTKVRKTPTASFSATPTSLPCWSQGGQLEIREYYTSQIENPLIFKIYLPPCYYQESERHYPTLYLLHGLHYTENQWIRIGVVEKANDLMAQGEIPPFLIVMPRDENWDLPPVNKYGESIVSELVPWVDSKYRTMPTQAFRAIGGISRGGNWAINIGLQHWEMFSAIGAHSAPIFYSDGLRIPQWLEEIPSRKMPRIFLDIGEDDGYGDFTHQLEKILVERGIPHEWHLNPGRHNEEYWREHLDQYLHWYSETW